MIKSIKEIISFSSLFSETMSKDESFVMDWLVKNKEKSVNKTIQKLVDTLYTEEPLEEAVVFVNLSKQEIINIKVNFLNYLAYYN